MTFCAYQFYNRLWTSYLPALCVFTLLLTIASEFYFNDFIFSLLTPRLCAIVLLVMISAFLFGAGLAFLGRQSTSRIVAASIESGVRSSLLTTVLLSNTLPAPHGDIARIAPVLYTLLSVGPTLVLILMQRFHRGFQASAQKKCNKEKSVCDESQATAMELLDSQVTTM